jgi:hypothetical protein
MAEEYTLVPPPGPALRDSSYQDLCSFFATFEEGKAWRPQVGDWVVPSVGAEPLLVIGYAVSDDRLSLRNPADGSTGEQPRGACIWLPTLDQVRQLIRARFGTTGFFSSAFDDSTYWYTGQMLGMTVTNMQPLAEGKSPEEAALKALLMRHSW